jgi:signal transduction histidine kinase
MFEALRWRLTAWYVLVFSVVFVAVGVIVFLWADQRFSGAVHSAIRDVSDAARVEVAERGDIAATDADVRLLLANTSLSGSADVFVVLLNPDGSVAANPSDVPLVGLPDEQSVERARIRGDDTSAYSIHSQDLEIRTLAVYDDNGRLLGFVQAGKSVEERDSSLRTLILVIAGGGLTGLLLSAAGGLFVAGIAIRPVRRSFERQREFVADASHELRTPLAVIRVNAESVGRSQNPQEAMSDIVVEASYMTRLLDDLLLLAGSDHEAMDLQIARVDLAEIARSAARSAATLAASAGLRLDAETQGTLAVAADAERCREVMLVLLDNAVKYTPAGGSIALRSRVEQGDAVISVSDTGIGIVAGDIPRVFDRFYRVDKARSRAMGGAGLGLSIAREIMDAHGGTLTIESEPGRGTTATMRLPLAKS